jgi:coenzyme F420-reducing hydrogenase gamma subunit
MSGTQHRPRLAVWKFASCDGCQLTLLDCEDELLAIADAVDIAYFLEASTAVDDGPFDVSLVEGSITTPADVERIRHVRSVSRTLVTLGACATAGGVQALRDLASVEEFAAYVYPRPAEIDALATSTPISAHVDVDLELRGCPIDPGQLVELVSALLTGRRPALAGHCVCAECKQAGAVCVTVAAGTPCLGPITQGGCGAICPRYARGCYGCFGPMDHPNPAAMAAALGATGLPEADQLRLVRTFNVGAPELAEVGVSIVTGVDGERS